MSNWRDVLDKLDVPLDEIRFLSGIDSEHGGVGDLIVEHIRYAQADAWDAACAQFEPTLRCDGTNCLHTRQENPYREGGGE